MDPLNPSPAMAHRVDVDPVERDLRSLRLAVQIMLVSLVILSGSMGVYLFRQVSLLRRQVEASTRVAQQLARNFNINVATQAMAFEKKLIAFGRTNPAFNAQISRFFASTSSLPAQPALLPPSDSAPHPAGTPSTAP